MKKLVAATVLALTLVPLGSATNNQPQSQRHELATELHKHRSVVRFFNSHAWMRATRQEKCSVVPWQRTCRIARALHAKHLAALHRVKRQLFHFLPYTNDWRTAVRLVQRIYPGTEAWLLFISAREGGHGRFVMNHQGSGAGGWMQFMSSTFYGYVGAARADVARRGFTVSTLVWSWRHPLGQALTAGYMRFTGRDGCHWCL